MAGVAASGGSTNAVLHLLAIAREMGIPLSIDDFDIISKRTPYICSLTPAGKYVASDYQAAGGSRLLAKRLIDAGHADGLAGRGQPCGRRGQHPPHERRARPPG